MGCVQSKKKNDMFETDASNKAAPPANPDCSESLKITSEDQYEQVKKDSEEDVYVNRLIEDLNL